MGLAEREKELADILLAEGKYEQIIELGRKLPPFPVEAKVEENLVAGCQSVLYLECTSRGGALYFNADSDALISKGLAALLVYLYSGEPASSLFTHPPQFLQGLGLQLSPARSNGLASLYAKMRLRAAELMTREGAVL